MKYLLALLVVMAACVPLSPHAGATDAGQTADLGLGPESGGGSATAVTLAGDVTGNSGANTLANNATARSDIGLGTTDQPQFQNLQIGDGVIAQDKVISLSSNVGSRETVRFMSGAFWRWDIFKDNVSESGGNSGSNFNICAYADNSALIDTPISIVRAAGGAITLTRPVDDTAAMTVAGAATLAGVACTSLVNSGAETANSITATGAANFGSVPSPGAIGGGTPGSATFSAVVDSGAFTATGAAILAGGLTIEDPTTPTKTMNVSLSGQSAATTQTFSWGAQTAGRTLSVPVLSANDTLVTLGVSNTFTGNNASSGTFTFSNITGARVSGNASAAQGSSGNGSMYRANGTMENAGSVIIQTDPISTASTAVVALWAGVVPQHCFSSGTSASTVYTGFADGNNITASFSTGGSATIAAAVLTEINTNTSTIATYFLWLPAAPNNGQTVEFVSEGTITSLTMSGNGHTLVGGATTITGPNRQTYIYNAAATTWYREQ